MGGNLLGRRAVFLDRDGVINEDWYSPQTGEWESPLDPADFVLRSGVLEALRELQEAKFKLFLVSNQPSFAKGKCTLDALKAVHARFEELLAEAGIRFTAFYYSYCHPQGVVPGYAGECPDRKPNPYFLHQAATDHGIDLRASWMIGDRETDIECGQRAGTRTIRVFNPNNADRKPGPRPDHSVVGLPEAVAFILPSK